MKFFKEFVQTCKWLLEQTVSGCVASNGLGDDIFTQWSAADWSGFYVFLETPARIYTNFFQDSE